MSERHQYAPQCVYLLADSLDSVLAACEDLLASRTGDPCELFRLELAAITGTTQARRCIDQLNAIEPEVLDKSTLFLAATDSLDVAHLRRGQILRLQIKSMAVSDQYPIGDAMPLGILAQIAATLLDTLEAHYVLYDGENELQSSRGDEQLLDTAA